MHMHMHMHICTMLLSLMARITLYTPSRRTPPSQRIFFATYST